MPLGKRPFCDPRRPHTLSYNVISWLCKSWSYTMLVSMSSNHYLPYSVNQGEALSPPGLAPAAPSLALLADVHVHPRRPIARRPPALARLLTHPRVPSLGHPLAPTYSFTREAARLSTPSPKQSPPTHFAGACELLRVLYLDRYPQLPYCGRATLPEQLWIYEVAGCVTAWGTGDVGGGGAQPPKEVGA